MTPQARVASAIEILDIFEENMRPLADILKEWGIGHRFAGSKDRAAISSLVYDTLRVKSSAQELMDKKTSRAAVIGMLKLLRGEQDIQRFFTGDKYSSPELTPKEINALSKGLATDLPLRTLGDCPHWLAPHFEHFAEPLKEMQALAARAPMDIRVNTLKNTREEVTKMLAFAFPKQTPHSPLGLRFWHDEDGRGAALTQEVAFLKGFYEVQDEGSQLVASLCGVKKGEHVIDLCAGGGGKSLVFAAEMQNEGVIEATDIDRRRLSPLALRAERAGATIIELKPPMARDHEPLDTLADLVVIDAPCTGVGTWRRNPDAKWRIREGAFNQRLAEQKDVLARAVRLVKPNGRIAYITCSMLNEENDAQIAAFLEENPLFVPQKLTPSFPHYQTRFGVQLTPYKTGTDGFYICVMAKA